jgi:integrase
MKKTKIAIKDRELDKELEKFNRWLDTQTNKTLYRKYRIKRPLKPGHKKWVLQKVKTSLKKHIQKLPSKLTQADIKDWEEYCYQNYKNNGNISRFMAMNRLLTYLGHEDWTLKLPPVERKVFPTLTEEERTRYLQTLQKNCEGINITNIKDMTNTQIKCILNRGLVMIQATLEARPSEICKIETKNIDFERHKIILSDSKTHEMIIRMGMEDALIMTTQVEHAIKEWLKIRTQIQAKKPEDEKYLFIHPIGKYKGRKIEYNKILRTCKEIGVQANITSIKTNPYTLKRTEITRDCDRTNNIRIPQIRARHTNYNSTMRYNHKNTQDVIKYIHSEEYADQQHKIKTQLQTLAQKAAIGEIPIEIWKQLRSDLEMKKTSTKNEENLVGYS